MKLKIKRLDHHGIVAGVIEDLKIVNLLDQYLRANGSKISNQI
ncbi:DUF4277 domain-containing protein [Parashewanella spongiae]|nr:DUF4277 domain-containing protein [Parashewanella spongiae]MCL1080354.1 DUF4277 domain-containing protein [Parashewanella spongiae]